MPKFDVNHFIKKFEAIPEDDWTTGEFVSPEGKRCALGHCGTTSFTGNIEVGRVITEEGKALNQLIVQLGALEFMPYAGPVGAVPIINDNQSQRYPQPTPKQRVLAALYDVRELVIEPIQVDNNQPQEVSHVS